MHDMMNMTGPMGWGMGLMLLLFLALVFLGIAALAKYVFFR
jgi:hypothetical protein